MMQTTYQNVVSSGLIAERPGQWKLLDDFSFLLVLYFIRRIFRYIGNNLFPSAVLYLYVARGRRTTLKKATSASRNIKTGQ